MLSGLVLNQRKGLRQLLHDVLSGDVIFKAILVIVTCPFPSGEPADDEGSRVLLLRTH